MTANLLSIVRTLLSCHLASTVLAFASLGCAASDGDDADHVLDGGAVGTRPLAERAATCGDGEQPTHLACTGLYASWPARTLAPGVKAYDLEHALWSDGADKHRYILLPAGSKIDSSNMDEWAFPVGTKLWKEFVLRGKKIETRLLWKRGPGNWLMTVYVWSADGSTAVEVTTGVKNVNGTTYEIPSQGQCMACHAGRIDRVLGYELLSLTRASATRLLRDGELTAPPARPLAIPGSAVEARALGYLHANCGTACHNRSPGALANRTGLYMRLEVAKLGSAAATDTYRTAVNVPSTFQPTPGAGFLRVKPRDVSHSAIPYRDGYRDTGNEHVQMPPISTHVVDAVGVAVVRSWIERM